MEELGIVKINDKIKAPGFELKDLNGTVVRLEDLKGKVVFLNFWATWCPPCRDEMPSMEKLYTKFKGEDFTIVAIDLRESPKKVRAFKKRYRLNFPILLDTDGMTGLTYGVRSIPTTYLVDKEGHVIGGALGARDWASTEAFKLIEQLVNSSRSS
jgi:peroxiredoxin